MRLVLCFAAVMFAWPALAMSFDPLHLHRALTQASFVVIGWNHVPDSPVPRELIAQASDLAQAGLQALLLETPSDYADDFAKGDFSYLLQTTSGARRLRVAQAFYVQGVAVVPADVDERWMSINPLALRKKDPAYKTFDERWMRLRDNHFVDIAQKRLAQSPRAKVILLVGAAHAEAIAKIAHAGGISCRVIDVRDLHIGHSFDAKRQELDDEVLDAQMVLHILDGELTTAATDLKKQSCPWPAATWPIETQKKLLAWRQAAILLKEPATRRIARPLEIPLRAVADLQKTFPSRLQAAMILATHSPPDRQADANQLIDEAQATEKLLQAALPAYDLSSQSTVDVGPQGHFSLHSEGEGLWTEQCTDSKGNVVEHQLKTSGETLCPETRASTGSSHP